MAPTNVAIEAQNIFSESKMVLDLTRQELLSAVKILIKETVGETIIEIENCYDYFEDGTDVLTLRPENGPYNAIPRHQNGLVIKSFPRLILLPQSENPRRGLLKGIATLWAIKSHYSYMRKPQKPTAIYDIDPNAFFASDPCRHEEPQIIPIMHCYISQSLAKETLGRYYDRFMKELREPDFNFL